MVSNIGNRVSPSLPSRRRTRLLSTSDARPSRTSMSASGADRLDRLEVDAPANTEKHANSSLVGRLEQVVAPARWHLAASAGGPAGRARRRRGATAGAPGDPAIAAGRQQLDARRGELDGQRQAVEPVADLDHRRAGSRSVETRSSGITARARSTNSATASNCGAPVDARHRPSRVRHRERRHRVLPLPVDPERLAAGRPGCPARARRPAAP